MSGKRKYGVTKPISMIGPNETDLHRTRQLEEFLVSAGLYESLEDGALRKEVLAQIDLIAKAWVKRITHERGYGEQLVEEENAKIYTFGSLSFVVNSWTSTECLHALAESQRWKFAPEEVINEVCLQATRALIHAKLVPPVIFKHIFREHNMLADGLQKQALKMELGSGYFTETLDGKETYQLAGLA